MNIGRTTTWLGVMGFLLVAAVPYSDTSAATNTVVGTISATRQFAAYANDHLLPSALCVYAEHVKREWLRRMGMADNWRDPILFVVRPRDATQTNAPAISMAVFQTDEHLKYQIRCLVPPRVDEANLLSATVDALSSEFVNRKQPIARNASYTVASTPLWLVEGLAASIQGRYGLMLTVAQRSLSAGHPQPAGDLCGSRQMPSDSMERQLYQANAWLFTEGLLGLPDGPRKLRGFLSALGDQKNVTNAFWSVYRRDFPTDTYFEKWWNLELLRRTSATLAQNLSIEDTTHQLDAILTTKLGRDKGRGRIADDVNVPIDSLWHYNEASWLKDVLKIKIDRLGTLRSQAHPLYQPVLDEYLDAMTALYQGSASRFRRNLSHAGALRAAVDKQSRGIATYLDQAERIYAPEELSKVFTGYFQTLDQVQQLDGERRSPISDYLDKFDH